MTDMANLGSEQIRSCQTTSDIHPEAHEKLSKSRSYSISLAPHIIHARSPVIQALITSQVYRQLEFVAVGNWWIYKSIEKSDPSSPDDDTTAADSTFTFQKVPNGREDIFADNDLDLRSKRALMKFLKIVADFESNEELRAHANYPFREYLLEKLRLPPSLVNPLLSLALSHSEAQDISTSSAISQIATHLRSIGAFGPGFGAVIPKWGGTSEICQVACRASAVGGAVYMLDQGVKSYDVATSDNGESPESAGAVAVTLDSGEVLKSKWLFGGLPDIPLPGDTTREPGPSIAKSITIIDSTLDKFFLALAEGAPPPAVSVLYFPADSLSSNAAGKGNPPIYVTIHSGDTGECPRQQCEYNLSILLPPSASKMMSFFIILIYIV
jgi:hypothetical protein